MTMMMKRAMGIAVAAIALGGLAALPARAQGTQDKPAPLPTLPTKVEVVISRYQGEKKIASQPYVLMPTSDPRSGGYASLRIGVDIPVGTTQTTKPGDPDKHIDTVTTTKPTYQNVGTNIDCHVTPMADGRYSVNVNVTDSSIFTAEGTAKFGDTPAIRSFQAGNTMTMRDGQTMVLTTATDKVTGELLKIEVTFSVVK